MPENPKKLSREEIANIEVGQTDVSVWLAWAIAIFFVIIVLSMPIAQYISDRSARELADNRVFALLKKSPEIARVWSGADGGPMRKTLAANARLLFLINAFDDDLNNESILSGLLMGPTQALLLRAGGLGNEKGYPGKDGWLFYRPAIDSLTGPGFLWPRRLANRSKESSEYAKAPEPDPRKAILDFRDQLSKRNIELVLVPAPAKGSIHPERFSTRYENAKAPVQNPSFDAFISEIREAGVHVIDPAALLWARRKENKADLFLKTDTHWTPESMEQTAKAIGEFLRDKIGVRTGVASLKRESSKVSSRGDIAAMLRLPESMNPYTSETISVKQVTDASRRPWRSSKEAEVLLLGDSYTNIYASSRMNWGDSAGLAEQLSYALQAPVDCISQNDAGAHATRQTLSRELAKGRDRLKGKKVVVWEFAARELALGDWKILDMKLGEPKPSQFIAPKPGARLDVVATIESVSFVPRPGSVPYKDHILTLHLRDIMPLDSDAGNAPSEKIDRQAVVYIWSMRDNHWTNPARYKTGETVNLRLRPWLDVAQKYEAINRSELDNIELLLEEPCWGEEIRSPASKQ